MSTDIDVLRIRKVLGRDVWSSPRQFGPDGWAMKMVADGEIEASVIVSAHSYGTAHTWVHASLARPDRMPGYEDMALLHRAVFGNGYAVLPFVPPHEHVNIHEFCLHLFGRADGKRPDCIPDFAIDGTV